jgi:hypothetical protein
MWSRLYWWRNREGKVQSGVPVGAETLPRRVLQHPFVESGVGSFYHYENTNPGHRGLATVTGTEPVRANETASFPASTALGRSTCIVAEVTDANVTTRARYRPTSF